MSYTLEELLQKIAERYDPDELLDVLQLNTEQLVYYLEEAIKDKLQEFKHLEEEL